MRGISTVVETARLILREKHDGPVDFMIAAGHGRSFGVDSSILTRRLPGILPCALWDALSVRPPLPTYALITDLGNDIFYNQSSASLSIWLTHMIARLESMHALVVLTSLPIENALKISPRQYAFVRRLFYPGCSLTLTEALTIAREFDLTARACAQSNSLPLIPLPARWYGWDPLHVQPRCWPEAWATILAPWSSSGTTTVRAAPSVRRAVYLKSRVPDSRFILGVHQRKRQPSGRLPDGSVISMF